MGATQVNRGGRPVRQRTDWLAEAERQLYPDRARLTKPEREHVVELARDLAGVPQLGSPTMQKRRSMALLTNRCACGSPCTGKRCRTCGDRERRNRNRAGGAR